MRLTPRLRLEPISPRHAHELWLLHQDDHIATWYGGTWSRQTAADAARTWGQGWSEDRAGKWLAYQQDTGELVGRGGLSYTDVAGARRLEIGWAIRRPFQGQGYATEIGRAGLALAFDHLDAPDVIAFTERHNQRSQAVMRRLGMHYTGQILRPGLVEGHHQIQPEAPFVLYTVQRPDPPNGHAAT
ncbi:GNAT family N-acetyltransferase [Cryptosporangium aurantiacum]|uniref:Protein N-acetyltransferase, RimJ/RimL family n=1 Tax=Cryptosporangium aurantiacum TaxID=134849 RepID=A0A1M7L025_9ACTN|nr:GNAT family N-acetyltransferase [Cryptosporangium aurantiacum]SHM71178.1 Protein N-acetyltransferase, RimJ/RimL family [Cryptosporangium aurantiacum]